MSDARTPRLRGRCGESVFVVGFLSALQVMTALCIGPYVVCSAVGCLPNLGVRTNGSPDLRPWSTPRRRTIPPRRRSQRLVEEP